MDATSEKDTLSLLHRRREEWLRQTVPSNMSRGLEGVVQASPRSLVPGQLAKSILQIGLAHSEGKQVVFGHTRNQLIGLVSSGGRLSFLFIPGLPDDASLYYVHSGQVIIWGLTTYAKKQNKRHERNMKLGIADPLSFPPRSSLTHYFACNS